MINYQEFLDYLEKQLSESLENDYGDWGFIEDIKKELIRNHEAYMERHSVMLLDDIGEDRPERSHEEYEQIIAKRDK